MASQTVTVPITLTAPAQLRPPQSAGDLAAVIIKNCSPYLISLTVQGDQHALPAYSSDMYPTTAANSVVQMSASNPDAAPAGLPSYVIGTWLDNDGAQSAGAYPSPLTPPPIAGGVAVGEILLQQGVPSVILEEELFAGAISHGGSQAIDVSGQATVAIRQVNGTTPPLRYTFLNPDGTGSDTDLIPCTDSANPEIVLTLQVRGVSLRIDNNDPAVNAVIAVTGSNRPATARSDARINTSSGESYAQTAAPFVAGTLYVMPDVYNANLQGAQFLDARVTGTTIQGTFEMIFQDGTGIGITLCDTAQFTAGTAASGAIRFFNDVIACPQCPVIVQFRCTTGGAGAIRATMIPMDL